MDTLSNSVSALKVHGRHPTPPREFGLFKPPQASYIPPRSHLSTTKPNSLSKTSSSSFPTKNSISPFLTSSQTSPLKYPSSITHHRAASGYAAALLDIAQCNNTVEAVARDVRRFSRLLRNEDLRSILVDPLIDDKTKGVMMKEIAEKGRFQRHLMVLLKMLIEKKKVGMVNEVLEEFERIYDELTGTRVVLVSSAQKMENEQLFGIAKRVQKQSGAMKVKVRQLINERSSSFAI